MHPTPVGLFRPHTLVGAPVGGRGADARFPRVEQHTEQHPGEPTGSTGAEHDAASLRDSLRLARRELKWTQIEHEHQAESLQRVRRQRARLREQLDLTSEALAAVLSEQYWAQERGPRAALGRLARRGRPDADASEADLVAEVEASDLFDGAWYLRQYPEAVRDRVAPAVHLVRHGNERGLDPSERFSTRAHLDARPDAGDLPALVHHLRTSAPGAGSAAARD